MKQDEKDLVADDKTEVHYHLSARVTFKLEKDTGTEYKNINTSKTEKINVNFNFEKNKNFINFPNSNNQIKLRNFNAIIIENDYYELLLSKNNNLFIKRYKKRLENGDYFFISYADDKGNKDTTYSGDTTKVFLKNSEQYYHGGTIDDYNHELISHP